MAQQFETNLNKCKKVLEILRPEIMKHETYSSIRNTYRNTRRHIQNCFCDNEGATSRSIEGLIKKSENVGIDVTEAKQIWNN